VRMRCLILFLIPFLMFGQGKASHGGSLIFNGTTTALSTPTSSSLQIRDSMTVEFWIKTNVAFGGSARYYTVGEYNTGFNLGWRGIIRYGGVAIQLWDSVGGGFNGASISIPAPYTLPNWTYFAFTFKPSLSIGYKNGDSITSNVETPARRIGYLDTVALSVGSTYGITNFNGQIRGVRLYHRVLSTAEIKWNYLHPDKIYSTDSLKLSYPLTEFTGIVVGDSSGGGHNGTVTNGAWSIDDPRNGTKMTHGSSLWFDGTDDSLNVPDNSSLDFSTTYSMEIWYKPITFTAVPPNEIASKNNAYYLATNVSTKKFQTYHIGVGGQTGWLVSKNSVVMNQRNHIAITYLSTDSIRYYFNGIRDTVYRATSGALDNTIYTLSIGGLLGTTRQSNCYIKEVKYYKRILPVTEILWDYNHPGQIYSRDSLKLWLQLNEFTGAIVYDSSGLANNGHISGAIWSIDQP